MRVYLAGPLFTTAEREFNVRLAEHLRRAGHEVLLPQEGEPRQGPVGQAMFDRNVADIDRADVVVANMDGSDPDSGTCWECGYAYGKKPVVLFRTDFRAADEPGTALYNFMLLAAATRHAEFPFADTATVAEGILDILAAL